jgi:hypothetical protein
MTTGQQATSSSVDVDAGFNDWWYSAAHDNWHAKAAAREAWHASIKRAQQEIETWHKIWNDVDLLSGRVEAMRDGTADLGEVGAFRLGQPVPPESGQAQRRQGRCLCEFAIEQKAGEPIVHDRRCEKAQRGQGR